MATVKVSEETYRRLNRLAGQMRAKSGRPVSFDEALDSVLKTRKGGSSPSDYIGSWSSMSDREEEEILRGLDNFWKGWKPRRS